VTRLIHRWCKQLDQLLKESIDHAVVTAASPAASSAGIHVSFEKEPCKIRVLFGDFLVETVGVYSPPVASSADLYVSFEKEP